MPQFGLIGFPLSHSFSQKFFTEKFENLNLRDHHYELFPIEEIIQFNALFAEHRDLKGLNVTIPYKVSVIPFLDELDETAKKIGAVNTILKTSGKLVGYNTDAYGFEMSLKPLLQPNHYKALILGNGGASKAVQYVLEKLGIEYLIVSRKPSSGELSYDELNENVLKTFFLIINTTPLGMYPNIDQCPQLPYEYLTPEHFLYDLVYNPLKTMFLQQGEKKDCIIQNGLTMLKMQAEKAWTIWNGK